VLSSKNSVTAGNNRLPSSQFIQVLTSPRPCSVAHGLIAAGSRVIRAAMNGRAQRVCSGKKTRPTSSGSSIDRTASKFCTTFVRNLPWVIAQPLGRPVVPDA
jgi:hypothetical protein